MGSHVRVPAPSQTPLSVVPNRRERVINRAERSHAKSNKRERETHGNMFGRCVASRHHLFSGPYRAIPTHRSHRHKNSSYSPWENPDAIEPRAPSGQTLSRSPSSRLPILSWRRFGRRAFCPSSGIFRAPSPGSAAPPPPPSPTSSRTPNAASCCCVSRSFPLSSPKPSPMPAWRAAPPAGRFSSCSPRKRRPTSVFTCTESMF